VRVVVSAKTSPPWSVAAQVRRIETHIKSQNTTSIFCIYILSPIFFGFYIFQLKFILKNFGFILMSIIGESAIFFFFWKLHFTYMKYLSIFTFTFIVSSVTLNPSNFQIVAI
jgi:hypothetical protein